MKNFKNLIASFLIFCIATAGFPMAAQATSLPMTVRPVQPPPTGVGQFFSGT
jgi:hypothetical protein